jgi:hypothetical protein
MRAIRITAVAAAAAIVAMLPAQAADLVLDKVVGVYKKSFQNGLVTGEKYRSENTLEIIKVSPTTAFFRTQLEFFNGHECSLSGVAVVHDKTLIYRGDNNAGNKQCVMTLQFDKGKISFDDQDGICQSMSCGARGGYSGITFATARRRTIRDVAAIVKSDEYKDAIAEFDKHAKGDAK